MYYFRSRVGLFRIIPANGRYYLVLNDNVLGAYNSPIAAADDVYTHTTGDWSWDRLDGLVSSPTDLSVWKEM